MNKTKLVLTILDLAGEYYNPYSILYNLTYKELLEVHHLMTTACIRAAARVTDSYQSSAHESC